LIGSNRLIDSEITQSRDIYHRCLNDIDGTKSDKVIKKRFKNTYLFRNPQAT